MRRNVHLGLQKLTVSLSSECNHRLLSLQASTFVMAKSGGVSDRELTIEDEDGRHKVVGEMALLGATGNVKQRMLKIQQDFLGPLLQNFDSHIQDDYVAHLLRDIFDFRAMLLCF
jgi:hypothetical protein